MSKNSPEANAGLRRERDSLAGYLEAMLGDDGVFLFPTHPTPAPYHNRPIVTLADCAYTIIYNVLGLPATAVPMGLATAEGVPVGVQIIAGRHRDCLNLAVAVELELAFGGWVPPFPTDEQTSSQRV